MKYDIMIACRLLFVYKLSHLLTERVEHSQRTNELFGKP
jgi:hypothetical protein